MAGHQFTERKIPTPAISLHPRKLNPSGRYLAFSDSESADAMRRHWSREAGGCRRPPGSARVAVAQPAENHPPDAAALTTCIIQQLLFQGQLPSPLTAAAPGQHRWTLASWLGFDFHIPISWYSRQRLCSDSRLNRRSFDSINLAKMADGLFGWLSHLEWSVSIWDLERTSFKQKFPDWASNGFELAMWKTPGARFNSSTRALIQLEAESGWHSVHFFFYESIMLKMMTNPAVKFNFTEMSSLLEKMASGKLNWTELWLAREIFSRLQSLIINQVIFFFF